MRHKQNSKAAAFCALSILALFPVPTMSEEDGFFSDDKGLIRSVMPHDWSFYRLMGPCKNLHLERTPYAGHPGFGIQGECPIKNLTDGDSECPSYLLVASGTVDTPKTATIRKINLTLKCYGE